MSLLFIAPGRDLSGIESALQKLDPNIDIDIWPAVSSKERVRMAVCWNHPAHVLSEFPNLVLASSLGAGVNHLLNDGSLDEDIALSRVVTNDLKDQMTEYALMSVLAYRRKFARYVEQKREAHWSVSSPVPMSDSVIGVMGLGEMGMTIARSFAKLGYRVNGWNRSGKNTSDVQVYTGKDQLKSFLENSNIIICTLPLTVETEGILNLDLFKQIRKPGYFINMGRGSHLVEEDLIYALDVRELEGACLDVFEKEPLSPDHIFWNRPNIMITPHIAALTDDEEAASVILENYKRCLSGMDPLFKVDRKKGY
ncbi:2-hydroxyacid dehydrogenase [Balneola sp. MJW-20]|uniref:2-hydroxyacid dehydrogenase n=1 Tax=Gracilimonas aurantiaca TaxID=3234185 RepID=UPI0034656F19